MNRPFFLLACVCAAAWSFLGVLIVNDFFFKSDGLVAVRSFDYTNVNQEKQYKIVCTHRGNRADLDPSGVGITVGDILVRRCEVKPL